ncbi:hypothetical protein NVP1170O_009 [Vibrio phage 1.170.O._10N.261.52.C3]|nr:hypothetical protein NVP1170O_009 [Vibrio phage 1.170.O._10N.261.52.C3]
MENKYWVKYKFLNDEYGWGIVSEFVTVGEDCEFPDLESWWYEESSGDIEHELLEVVKL